MKKIISSFITTVLTVIALTATICAFYSCKKPEDLSVYVSELRADVLEGRSENFFVRCVYGFRETPYAADGEIGTREYSLTFFLPENDTDDVNYALSFTLNGNAQGGIFVKDKVSSKLSLTLPVKNFSQKTLTVKISHASESETAELHSIVPQNCMNYRTALESLNKNQPSLINSMKDGGSFNGEICMRIIVKDGKAYWYAGLSDGKDFLKALLIDGVSGEILATRTVL